MRFLCVRLEVSRRGSYALQVPIAAGVSRHKLVKTQYPKKNHNSSCMHLNTATVSSTEKDFLRQPEQAPAAEFSNTGERDAATEEQVSGKQLLLSQPSADVPTTQEGRLNLATGEPRRGRRGVPHHEETKRQISAVMKRLHANKQHRQRISQALRGKLKICSICGESGHNRRGCTLGNLAATQVKIPRSRPLKRRSYAETKALRTKRRETRRNRPKSTYKGLSWNFRKERWHVKSVGYFIEEEQGARAYDSAIVRYRGPDAQCNFPIEMPEDEVVGSSSLYNSLVPPATVNDTVKQAVQSIVKAWQAGVSRQLVNFLLPSSTDAEDCSVQTDFQTARNLIEETLVQLKSCKELSGPVKVQWLDKTEFVGLWQSEKFAAVVFCTADCLQHLRRVDDGNRLVLVFNPQWQIDGQIVSDFGFGRNRRQAEEYVQSYEDVFVMQQRRIMGDTIRMLKIFGEQWQVYYVWPNGRGHMLLGKERLPPSYDQLLSMARAVPGSKSSLTWVERMLNTSWLPGLPNPLPSNTPMSKTISLDKPEAP